ncbi:hypothetical protein [Steroidobacter cummioxidans]|uniref:hypothetical protein n=1 Tax=Steroidobacter cummioxidans TaxID=1803913 RepID=UPI000E321F9F|nr:hypothetical protein [Steroidobacter cummioxidans]
MDEIDDLLMQGFLGNVTTLRTAWSHRKLFGVMPWPDWRDWRMSAGVLMPRGWNGRGVSAGEVAALPYLHQLLSELQRTKAETAADGRVATANPTPMPLRRKRQRTS